MSTDYAKGSDVPIIEDLRNAEKSLSSGHWGEMAGKAADIIESQDKAIAELVEQVWQLHHQMKEKMPYKDSIMYKRVETILAKHRPGDSHAKAD